MIDGLFTDWQSITQPIRPLPPNLCPGFIVLLASTDDYDYEHRCAEHEHEGKPEQRH